MGSVRSAAGAVAVLPCGGRHTGVRAELAAHLAGFVVCAVHLVCGAAGRFDFVLSSFEGASFCIWISWRTTVKAISIARCRSRLLVR